MRILCRPTATVGCLAVALLWGTACRAGTVPARPSRGCTVDRIEHGRELHRALEVAGLKRTYILDVPDSVRPHVPAPLLLDFHGFGDSAERLARVSGFREAAARDGFITIYPDGLPVHLLGREAPGWEILGTSGNRDLVLTTALLERLERDYCIDETRVFATGFSNGGFFTHLLGCTMADRFAAIAPVGGGLTVPCAPSRAVPVLIHHGRADPIVDVQRARQARDAWLMNDHCSQPFETAPEKMEPPQDRHAANECEWHRRCRDGAEVEYCENDGGHHWPAHASERIWEFFRNHPMRASEPVDR